MTPDERRDATVAHLIAHGAMVGEPIPMAHPDTPHTVALWVVPALSPTPQVDEALIADTRIEDAADAAAALIPWTPEPPVEEPPIVDPPVDVPAGG